MRKQYAGAINQINDELKDLLEEEQLVFKTQQLVYDHPLTQFIRQLQMNDRLALDSC